MGTRRTADASAKIAAKSVRSWHTRRGLTTVLVAWVVALMASGVSFGVGARTPVAHAAACHAYYSYFYTSDAYHSVSGDTSRLGVPPDGKGWVYPCSGEYVTINMDVWLSQQTGSSNTRLAESGRTGYETWAPDCQWHNQVTVVGWGQSFTVPLWACSWDDDTTSQTSSNGICAQDY